MTLSLSRRTSFDYPEPGVNRRSMAIGLALGAHLALVWLALRPPAGTAETDRRVWTPLLLPKATVPAPLVYLHLPVPASGSKPDAAAGKAGNADKTAAGQAADDARRQPAGRTPGITSGITSGIAQQDRPPGKPAGEASRAADQMPVDAGASGNREAAAADELSLGGGAAPAQPLPAGLLAQALKSAGAIDRQLRAERPQQFTAPADTPQTRMARGMAEAHAAVKPGLFEAPRIELFSLPNDPKRIYKVVTGMGEYCVFYPDKGSMTENLSARSGHAGFGQPRMGTCPTRF